MNMTAKIFLVFIAFFFAGIHCLSIPFFDIHKEMKSPNSKPIDPKEWKAANVKETEDDVPGKNEDPTLNEQALNEIDQSPFKTGRFETLSSRFKL